MQERADNDLLAQYARDQSEQAFATLVTRHVNLVYSVAMRHVANPHEAEEIAQVVFLLLARKAGSLSPQTILTGWLYRTARLTAANFIRMENRRHRREQEAHMQSLIPESEPETWLQISPMLDTAMEHLGASDRNAVVLRFFEGKSFKEVGEALRSSEGSAQKRVERALEKLRKFFARKGVVVPAAAFTIALSANSIQAAPVGLAESILAAGIAKGTVVSGSSLVLMKSTLSVMTWLKVKTVAFAGLTAILIAGTTTVTIAQIQKQMATAIPSALLAAQTPPPTAPPLAPMISALDKQGIFDPSAMAPNDPQDPVHTTGRNTPDLPLDSQDADGYVKRGRLYLVKKDFGKALADFNQALQLDPRSGAAYFNRARAYHLLGQNDQAIADYNQALTINPKLPGAYINRGEIYNQRQNYDQAIADFNEAIQIDPKKILAFNGRANAYIAKGYYDQAIADDNVAIGLDPTATFAYFNRARAYNLSGNYDQSIAGYDQVIQLDPGKPIPYLNRGVAYAARNDYEKAIADFNTALQLDPDFSQALNNLAWQMATCPDASFRDGAKAVEYATKACTLSNWTILSQIDTLAAAYAEAGDFDNAVKLEKQVAETPGLVADDAAMAKARVTLYEAHQPYHREPGPASPGGH